VSANAKESSAVGPGDGVAIVVGASMAGMVTARVLAEHFSRVVLIERDALEQGAAVRKGLPAAKHVHALLPSGLEILTRRFPGLLAALQQHRVVKADIGLLNCWYAYGGVKKQVAVGVDAVTMSRPLLDSAILEELRKVDRVQLMAGHRVTEYVLSEDRRRVVGVEVESRERAERSTLPAELVVDCTGRGSRVPNLLSQWGYPAPRQSKIAVGITYKSRRYRSSPTSSVPRRIYIHSPAAPHGKVGYMLMPIEGDDWMLTLAGWHGLDPLPDEARLCEQLARLPLPELQAVVSSAEPVTELAEYKFSHSLRRLYEELGSFPRGLLVLGDAVASVNPVYGQGMSLSCLQADALDGVLADGKSGGDLAARFYARIAPTIQACWMGATVEDFRYRETVGDKPAHTRLINAYLTVVHKASQSDPVVYGEFLRVAGLLKPAEALFSANVVMRSLGAAVRQALRPGSTRSHRQQ
jgi:2-polyprenyl-6-methoxyphenol hydroxylase-like FAD-dependent oxidoreductase